MQASCEHLVCLSRCEAKSWLHHPCPWRSGTHDCGHADEEHHQSSQECSAVSPREDPNGRCILMANKNATATHSSATLKFYFLLGATWYAPFSIPCTWTGKVIALWLSSFWHLTPPKFYTQPNSDCYILLMQQCVQRNTIVSIYHLHSILWGFMRSIDCIIYCYSGTFLKPGRSVAILLWADNWWNEPVLSCISPSLTYQYW